MAEDSSSQKVDSNLVAEIVSSYVRNNSVAIDQLGGLIATVHQTLSGLGTNAPAPAGADEKLAPGLLEPPPRSARVTASRALRGGKRLTG